MLSFKYVYMDDVVLYNIRMLMIVHMYCHFYQMYSICNNYRKICLFTVEIEYFFMCQYYKYPPSLIPILHITRLNNKRFVDIIETSPHYLRVKRTSNLFYTVVKCIEAQYLRVVNQSALGSINLADSCLWRKKKSRDKPQDELDYVVVCDRSRDRMLLIIITKSAKNSDR